MMSLGQMAGLGRQSLARDRALLRSSMPVALRWRFLVQKARVLPVLLGGHCATLDLGGFKFALESASDLGTFQSCMVDVQSELLLSGVLDPNGSQVIVDVGANIGQFASSVKILSPESQLICFEPDPTVFLRLVRNVSQLPNVEVRCLALGRQAGVAPLYRHPLSVMSSFYPSGDAYDRERTVNVNVAPLDDLLVDNERVDILKVDVEGSELDVLKGGIEVLKRSRYLLVEIGLSRDDRGTNLELMCLVRDAVPGARIIRFGRRLGTSAKPLCQDVLISLRRE
ncbi:MAG TPA: FkbM family methyltransferase [Candidatus Dormibacteraeota bacterium]|nr:FkbM family methyltransferase [Candidatus Dormibacteraeota bacterium]